MLNKFFSPASVEDEIYKIWEQSEYFAAHPEYVSKTPFTIMIPPPNVTGTLHMGHALTMTLQDIVVRWRRLQGYDVLWQPGTDHAGISTQLVVDRKLSQQGIDRKKIGRDAFLEHVWQWKKESGGEITKQLRRLGASLDWKRERFTLDDGLSEAVKKVFVTLYREGLIYQDRRLVNWDPHFRSAVSDLEVENKEINGHLWYIRYPIEGSNQHFITVATTRPETMLGDVAVAVHPSDERYKQWIGRYVRLPLTERVIPIIADEYSDPSKGTGAVKITPAHDFNDFEVGRRHNLELITILDAEANIDLHEIKEGDKTVFLSSLQGMSREKARNAIIEKLEQLALLEKVETYRHQVPHAERSGAIIEPRLTTQWYCDAATLSKPAIKAVQDGRIQFVPKQWENTYFAWMKELKPWCISRQLWWGHQIPAWYGPDDTVFVCYDEKEAEEQALKHYGSTQVLRRDDDVLDTWFSSALWPFTTLGWPENTPELQRYYPSNVLITGFDIIFFWVARMMMMGMHFKKDVPFHTVYLHGLVRDEKGQKMSKTKGNGIDPLEIINEYGADAMRFTVCALTGPGRDIKLGKKRIEEYRSFITKIWNAARFCEMNTVFLKEDFSLEGIAFPLNRWILNELSNVILKIDQSLEAYRFDEYASLCYHFTWDKFCDWYLEFAKIAFKSDDVHLVSETRSVSAYILKNLLIVLHPIIPFVTEELWSAFSFGDKGTLMIAQWPDFKKCGGLDNQQSVQEINYIITLISQLRGLRSEIGVPSAKFIPLLIKDIQSEFFVIIQRWSETIKRMVKIASIEVVQDFSSKNSIQTSIHGATFIFPLENIVNFDKEKNRLSKELFKLSQELERIQNKLSNENFMKKAKAEIIQETRERVVKLQSEENRLKLALNRFQ
ncbi:Valine--tRNA ligase [Commensalibacter sp. Nvir]|uniref:valine--tRNA ligase n=1 Tax=Commensalibacter sp. Nvir TaxID=3069817 RepID=UPI002D4891A7|nr:Valine--tRNA ligase [Commensalibacter sp. Nvir]